MKTPLIKLGYWDDRFSSIFVPLMEFVPGDYITIMFKISKEDNEFVNLEEIPYDLSDVENIIVDVKESCWKDGETKESYDFISYVEKENLPKGLFSLKLPPVETEKYAVGRYWYSVTLVWENDRRTILRDFIEFI